MDTSSVVQVLAAGLVIGLAVGATGVGGILLVPFLTFALGLDVRRAIAATLVSYLPSGVLAVWLYARRGSVRWRMAAPLCLAALPAALLGALVSGRAPAALLEALIGLIMLAGGAHGLWPRAEAGRKPHDLGWARLAGLGLITGFLSAMTGAGGALVLVPLLLMFDEPVLLSIGLGQTIAFPIALIATLANLGQGRLDIDVALMLAAGLAAGIALGTPLAHALPQALLKRILSTMIALLGAVILIRLVWRVLGATTSLFPS